MLGRLPHGRVGESPPSPTPRGHLGRREGTFSLDESRIDDIPQVSGEENGFLTAPFTEEEVRAAVFQMEHNKAPGPDGFPAEFYQNFWDIIKPEIGRAHV